MLRAQQKDDTRKLMIGAPLLLVLVFSFGFLLVHPVGSSDERSATTSPKPNNHGKTSPADNAASASQLSPMPTLPAVATPAATSSSSSDNAASAPAQSSGRTAPKPKASGPHNGRGQANDDNLFPPVVNSVLN